MTDIVYHQFDWHSNQSFEVFVHPKKCIEVHSRNGAGELTSIKMFRLGDIAEYDSYNLKYTGQITSITGKNVIIKPRFGSSTKRLDFRSFAWRNWNFDLDRISRENFETSQYI